MVARGGSIKRKKKPMGPGMQRRPPVKGGPVAPNPGSLLGAAGSLVRSGTVKQATGEGLINLGQMAGAWGAKTGRQLYDSQRGILPKDTSKQPTTIKPKPKRQRAGGASARRM